MFQFSEAMLKNQLKKAREIPVYETTLDTLNKWIKEASPKTGSESSAWLSNTLAVDLNLHMDKRPPDNLVCQIVCLSEGKPPLLCTLFDKPQKTECLGSSEEHDSEMAVKDYTVLMAQRLKTSLANFCHSDFAIFRLWMNTDDFNVESLKKAVENELEFTRIFFKGDVDLTAESYTDIKKAVDALTRGSFVPSLLQGQEDEVNYCIFFLLSYPSSS